MKRIEQLQKVIRGEKTYIFEEGCHLSYEEARVLSEMKAEGLASHASLVEQFAPAAIGVLWSGDLWCTECKEIRRFEGSKSKLLKYVFPPKRRNKYFDEYAFVCKECAEVIKQKEKQELRERRARWDKSIGVETDKYIEYYLDPNKSWTKDHSFKHKIHSVIAWYNDYLDHDRIAEVVNGMRYKDFLKTPYWDSVRLYKLKKSGFKCELCNASGKLAVHHKSYEKHGYEHKTVADLITLCEPCHQKFHDKIPDSGGSNP